MKKRLTLDLPPEIVSSIKKTAKERNMTVSQFMEELFLKYIAEEKFQTNLKKVS
jgi:hypothetical protein